MTEPENSQPASDAASAPAATHGGLGPRWKIGIIVIALLFVVMPFLFWRSTWFGLPLSDQQIEENLSDLENPRKAQHALTQISEHILRGDSAAKRWYPQVIALSRSKNDQLRITAAWVMGQDNTQADFRQALAPMLADDNPMVRHNAALSLVRFGDASGRADIVAMLRSYAMPAPQAGTLAQRLKIDDAVNPGTLVARIKFKAPGNPEEQELEVRSKVPGRIERWIALEGASVAAGEEIVLIAPSHDMIWEALRALYLVGQAEDLPDVERYLRRTEGRPSQISTQAGITAQKIRERSRTQ
ncbi:MAG: HEAT repeat domain-containing protein [Acidobacteria bacterium]|nr:HEAT repeat domain-containing protein [Acidobacteriota bacterium]MCL5288893.1 HEAT repeat domain-containing protein [Acidobacteriota bacterium]